MFRCWGESFSSNHQLTFFRCQVLLTEGMRIVQIGPKELMVFGRAWPSLNSKRSRMFWTLLDTFGYFWILLVIFYLDFTVHELEMFQTYPDVSGPGFSPVTSQKSGAFRSSACEDSRENENLQKGVALHPVELLLGVALLEICTFFLEKTKSYPRWLLWFMDIYGRYWCIYPSK